MLHMGKATALGNFPDRISQRKSDQMSLLTVPVFTLTTAEKKKNSHIFFLKHHHFRHERERIFCETDGIFLERLHFPKKADEIGHEHVEKFSMSVGFALKTHEKVSETPENFPKTLHGIYGSHRYFSASTGILPDRLQKFSERHGNFSERLRLVKGDR